MIGENLKQNNNLLITFKMIAKTFFLSKLAARITSETYCIYKLSNVTFDANIKKRKIRNKAKTGNSLFKKILHEHF